ncbi:putative hspc200 [Aspergillus californicus]
MPVNFAAPPPLPLAHVGALPSSIRRTPKAVLDEMKAACTARHFPRFKSAFDAWTPLNYRILDLASVMCEAIANNFVDAASELLRAGLPTDQIYAIDAITHRSTNILTLFLEHGWDINQPTEPLKPPALAYAVKDSEMTLWLLDHGADPNQQCRIDLTPLSWAVEDASLSTIKLILDRGGDVQRGAPLHHAVNRESEVVEVLSLLLERGASLNANMYENHELSRSMFFFMGLGPVIHQAACKGKADAVRYLLDRGADPTLRDATDRTALDWAVKSNKPEVITMLEQAVGNNATTSK